MIKGPGASSEPDPKVFDGACGALQKTPPASQDWMVTNGRKVS